MNNFIFAALWFVQIQGSEPASLSNVTDVCGLNADPSALTVGSREYEAWRYLDWTGLEARPSNAFIQQITGPCALEVVAGSGGTLRLRSGATFQYDLDGRGRRAAVSPKMFDADVFPEPPPEYRDAHFVQAAQVGGPKVGDGGQRDYLGLWRDDRGDLIASFSIIDGLGAGSPRGLVHSRDPIRSLVYFPAPDTQSGGVSFVQFSADGVVRLVGFGWDHPDAFPCLTPAQLVTRVPGGVAVPRRSDRRCG